jgi:hypothetical protein
LKSRFYEIRHCQNGTGSIIIKAGGGVSLATRFTKEDLEKAKERIAKEGLRSIYVKWPSNYPDRISIVTEKTEKMLQELELKRA